MSCIKQAPTNNEQSILYEQIYNELANGQESLAEAYYSHFTSNIFKADFGDYIADYRNGKTNERVDENGEPVLKKVQDGVFTYVAKDGSIRYFPSSRAKLSEKIDYRALDNAVSVMAVNFYLDSQTESKNFREYIKDVFNKRKQEIEAKGKPKGADRITLSVIKNLEEGMDEYVTMISNYYVALNLNFKEVDESENAVENIEEESKDPIFNRASFMTDPKANVRAGVKLRLAMIPDTLNTTNILGQKNYIPFENTYRDLLDIWTESYQYQEAGTSPEQPIVFTNVVDSMVVKLKRLISFKPQYSELLNFLQDENTPLNDKIEMYQAFNLQKNTILSTEVLINPDGMAHASKDMTSTTSKASSLRRELNSLFLQKQVVGEVMTDYRKDTSGEELETRIELKKQAVENIKEAAAKFEKLGVFVNSNLSFDTIIEEDTVREIFILKFEETFQDVFGYKLNDHTLDYYLDNQAAVAGNDRFAALHLVNRLKLDLMSLTSVVSKNLNKILMDGYQDINLLNNSSRLKGLMEAEVLFRDSDDTASVLTVSGNAYVYQNKNHLNTQLAVWKQDPEVLRTLRENTPWLKHSKWIAWLLADDEIDPTFKKNVSKKRLNEMKVNTLVDAYVMRDGEKVGIASKEMEKEEYMIDNIIKNLKPNANGTYTVKTTVPADKSQDLQLSIGYSSKNNFKNVFEEDGTNVVEVSEAVLNTFTDYFNDDVLRIYQAERKREFLEKAYQRGLKTWNSLSEDNRNYKKVFEEYLTLENDLVIHYDYKSKGSKRSHFDKKTNTFVKGEYVKGNAFESQLFPRLSYNFKSYKTAEQREQANQVRSVLYNEDGSLRQEIQASKGIITSQTITENGTFIRDEIKRYIQSSISEGILKTYNRMNRDGVLKRIEVTNDYETVTKVSGVLPLDLFNTYNKQYGENADYAIASDFYVNSVIRNIEYSKLFTGDIAYYKNTIDYKKRVPATYTDGITPVLSKPTIKYAVIDSVEVNKYLNYERLVDTLGETVANMFNGTNSADAQAWITPMRWKEIQKGISWSPVHESVYNKMISGANERYTSEELKVVMQPVKGVLFWRDQNGKPTFFKYSQAVLTPRLIKGTPLEAIYKKMADSKNGFDELITLDGVKVGAVNPTRIHNEDGTTINEEDIEFNIQEVDSRGWKLQQDLPTKTFKDTELGSQIQKNIYFSVKNNPDMIFNVDGKEVTGRDIITQMTNVIRNMSNAGMINLFKEFGFNEDGMVANVDTFYRMLTEELKQRNGSLAVIEALEKRINLAGMPQLRNKIDNMFASIINKRIVKIKTNGGSFIQMSNFGLNSKEAVSNGVKLHPALATFTRIVDSEGNPKLDEEGNTMSTMNTFEPYKYTETIDNRLKLEDLNSLELQELELEKYIQDIVDNKQLFDKFVDQLSEQGILKVEC